MHRSFQLRNQAFQKRIAMYIGYVYAGTAITSIARQIDYNCSGRSQELKRYRYLFSELVCGSYITGPIPWIVGAASVQ